MAIKISAKMIRIMGPGLRLDDNLTVYDERNQSALDGIDWLEVEDVVNNQLPEGYYCKVED